MIVRLCINQCMYRFLQGVCDAEQLGVLCTCCRGAEVHHRRASSDGSDLCLV